MSKAIVVCDADELARRALGGVIAEHGFEVAAESVLAVEAVQLAHAYQVAAVALSNELQGLSGLDVVEELEADGIRVILISNDERVLERARDAGAYFAIERGDLAMFDRALTAMGELREGDRRSGVDRRRGVDRRVRADWSQVIRERRSGEDRRLGERRVAASSEPADAGPHQALSA